MRLPGRGASTSASLVCPSEARIEGSVRNDTWTPESQAAYYAQFFTICYSHPNVDAVNLFGIGPKTWMEGEGVLDENGEPTPAFRSLKDLHQRWRTSLSGTLGADTAVGFRGFQGLYEVAVTLPAGSAAGGASFTAPISVLPGQGNVYRLKLDVAGGKLVPWEGR